MEANGVETIQKKLKEHDQRFDTIDARFDQMDTRMDKIEGRMDKIEGRMDKIDGRMDKIEGRMDKIDGRLGNMEGRQDRMEDKLHRNTLLLEDIQDTVKKILEVTAMNYERNVTRGEFEARFDGHETRISALESYVKRGAE